MPTGVVLAIGIAALAALANSAFQLWRVAKRERPSEVRITTPRGSSVRVNLSSDDEESIRSVIRSLDPGDE